MATPGSFGHYMDIASKADIAAHLNDVYGSEGLADIGTLVDTYHGRPHPVADRDSYGDRFVVIAGFEDFDISYPLDLGRDEMRYRLALGVGHYVLHYAEPAMTGEGEVLQVIPYPAPDRLLAEAETFAMGTLMPVSVFTHVLRQFKGTVPEANAEISRRFQVPAEIADVWRDFFDGPRPIE